ncbi:MAG: hypothetical protein AB7F40_09845 [Victivallaceae bacterium]|nr:hypothetical protein [Victivallaceae bacterium]
MLKGAAIRKLSWLFLGAALSCYAADAVNPDDYPAADHKEWGQLRWVLKIAGQPLDDFTNYECADEIGDSARRFEIAFSGYFLGAEQFHKFPAWDGPIQNGYDRLIRKMFEKPVWQYWSKDSAGRPLYEPGFDSPEAPTADPIAYRNIMYSGHIGMMIGQYEMLYNDMKWDEPGSIVLSWDDHTKFSYDNQSVQNAMFLQMITNPVPGIECEPNAIFPACNQHPILGWKHYDYLHGTRYYDAAAPLFKKWFEEVLLNQKTHEIAFAYLIKQGYVLAQWHPELGNVLDAKLIPAVKEGKISLNSPCNDGWVGAFMHAWAPEVIEKQYPYIRKYFVVVNPDGSEAVREDKMFLPDFLGFYTLLAAEMGDEETKIKLLERADKLYDPVWEDGTYHYKYFDTDYAFGAKPDDDKKAEKPEKCCCAEKEKETEKTHVAVPMGSLGLGKCCKEKFQSDNVQDRLFGMARALPPSGLLKMYSEPFDRQHFSEPKITDVDITAVILKRAIYDRAKAALVVSTIGGGSDGETGFKVVNLSPDRKYVLTDNGRRMAEIGGVREYQVKFNGKDSHDFILVEAVAK